MSSRFIYGLCFIILVGYGAYKAWNTISFSPQEVIEVAHAYDHNLTGRDVKVAILDEGFDTSHSGLQKQLSAYRYNTNNRSRDISESVIFEEGQFGLESHGTHVAGIITGLAPEVEVIPIKVGGLGGDQSFVKALQIAASSQADIVNISMKLSYTGREVSPNVRNALIQLAQSGKLIIIAAGNESAPMMRQAYTASLVELSHHPHINGRLLMVGASSYKNGKETLASFSNYPGRNPFGFKNSYFITAPGEHIMSFITGGTTGEKSGTSMAAPIVVGSASLLKQALPSLKAEEIAQVLLRSARRISLDGKKLSRATFGAGIVNLRSALEILKGK